MNKQIPLSHGQFALVDDEDFDFLNQWKWRFGKCILQKLYDSPSFIGGHVDSSIRQYRRGDVDYDLAPPLLTEIEDGDSV